MSPVEHLAMYATETRAIIYVLVIIIFVLGGLLLNVYLLYAIQKMKIRGWRKHERHLATELAARAAEIVSLREALGDVEVLKFEIRKLDRIRDKSFARLNENRETIENMQMETYRLENESASLRSQNESLQGIIEEYRQKFEQPAA